MNRSREYPERPVVGVGGVVISDGRVLLVRRGAAAARGGMVDSRRNAGDGRDDYGRRTARAIGGNRGWKCACGELIEVFERISLDGEGKAQYHYVVLDYFCEAVRVARRAAGQRCGGDCLGGRKPNLASTADAESLRDSEGV